MPLGPKLTKEQNISELLFAMTYEILRVILTVLSELGNRKMGY